jgi:K+-sensing histidine kinase KdpD
MGYGSSITYCGKKGKAGQQRKAETAHTPLVTNLLDRTRLSSSELNKNSRLTIEKQVLNSEVSLQIY